VEKLGLTIVILCVVILVSVGASSGPAKPRCQYPGCKTPIFKEGEDKLDRMMKGTFKPIHVYHRMDEEAMKEAKLAQAKWGKK
jgi:hypothetical protein